MNKIKTKCKIKSKRKLTELTFVSLCDIMYYALFHGFWLATAVLRAKAVGFLQILKEAKASKFIIIWRT
jgi:hypothetical protein